VPRSRDGQPVVPEAAPTSYYGHPIIKAPVWKWPIPAYLFTGGLAAGTALVGAGASIGGDARLARRASLGTVGAAAVSGVFLIQDLGRPSRFHHMLRVFKPTSPMSVGTWIFSAFSTMAGGALGAEILGARASRAEILGARASRAGSRASLRRRRAAARRGPWAAVAHAGHLGAAALAPALATYTAVLVADTAVPAWHEGRRQLPFLFAGGAAASGGALGVVLAGSAPAAAGPRRLALAGSVAEVAMAEIMHWRMGDLAEPYHEGPAGILSQGARAVTVAGAALLAVGSRRRPVAVAGSVALLTGAALERFAVFHAGLQSARDPKYVVGPQRRGLVSSATRA